MFNSFFEYHNKTKHSYYSVRSFPNRLDWDNQPSAFKSYPKEFKKIELDLEKENHSFIYYIAGITAKKSYPGVEYYLRVNPSAGALYPNEIYFQSRNNKDIEDGIYHFDIASSSITLLKKIKQDGVESYFGLNKKTEGFIFLLSSIYYRSSWKYKNRAFRYCLLDAGHLLGCLEISSYIHNKEYEIKYDFDKKGLNALFSFDNKEFFTSSFLITKSLDQEVLELKLDLPTIDGSYYFEENQMIESAYKESLNLLNPKEESQKPSFNFSKNYFKEVVLKRRSIREFAKQSISKIEFETIMKLLNEPIPSDCNETLDIYCVINRVEKMKLGLIKNGEYIKEGDFMSKAGYLCLEQDLGKSSAVTFFITSNSNNYQAMYQKAGILGHRLYLVSNYLKIGCSGIGAYYDDEVCEFLGEYTQVLYALAIGK
ncbi:SagB family peptide dehydrogenase [Halarcobacter ebronensis]|uniref:Dehydrogenase n=1 Tax=Halarcobacter ebronensis TaxID=1462615 RepID=A0A4Q1AQC2_9BACT|nr:SagB family peptide dehydrogenase [Halarcobacter ebronensis]QKF81560.1 putative McbC-like oxidoreductase [Halarcobacter ebronensis]RXK05488.1 dehydrogenase [Halarcobacter ebronensis]